MKDIIKQVNRIQKVYKESISYLRRSLAYDLYWCSREVRQSLSIPVKCNTKKVNNLSDRLSNLEIAIINYDLPTQKHIREELEYCADTYSPIEFHGNNLICTTRNMKINSVSFGKYSVYFDYENKTSTQFDFQNPSVRVFSKSNKDRGAYCHPNVSYSELCAGNGREALGMAMLQFRPSDYFEIVEQILSSTSRNPYLSYTRWKEKECKDCGDVVPRRVRCIKCLELFCKSCIAINKTCHGCKK